MVQWGSVGEWVSGVGALAAVGATLAIWLRDRTDRKLAEHRLIDLQTQEIDLQTREAKRSSLEQAASIRAWWDDEALILMLGTAVDRLTAGASA